jgi:hypothetical protein
VVLLRTFTGKSYESASHRAHAIFQHASYAGGRLMWPLTEYGFPPGYYLVRNEALAFASTLASDMDVIATGGKPLPDRSLVRFATPWARASLIAEWTWRIEAVVHGAFSRPQLPLRKSLLTVHRVHTLPARCCPLG